MHEPGALLSEGYCCGWHRLPKRPDEAPKRKAVDANGPVFPSPIEEKEGLKEYD
jgi:hypothetical protein